MSRFTLAVPLRPRDKPGDWVGEYVELTFGRGALKAWARIAQVTVRHQRRGEGCADVVFDVGEVVRARRDDDVASGTWAVAPPAGYWGNDVTGTGPGH